ncbi:MAG: hypothetical protein ABWZ83_13635, partial [Mesorhizobium sp.]
ILLLETATWFDQKNARQSGHPVLYSPHRARKYSTVPVIGSHPYYRLVATGQWPCWHHADRNEGARAAYTQVAPRAASAGRHHLNINVPVLE